MSENRFAIILEKFAQWAKTQSDILSVIVVGSQARQNHPADNWSDLDLVIYTTNPARFLEENSWMHQFGEVWASAIDFTPRHDPEWFIFYAGGYKVDILFVDPVNLEGDNLAHWVLHPDFLQVYSRGIRSIVDKSSSRGSLPELSALSVAHAPSQLEMTSHVHRFYLSALRAGRLIYREDLWRARQATDEEMKLLLLRMIEWHSLSVNGLEYEIWYDGRFLAEWADPQVLARLPTCFSHYDRGSLETAFKNTVDLFEDLGQLTCRNFGLEYPHSTSLHIRTWLSENLSLTK